MKKIHLNTRLSGRWLSAWPAATCWLRGKRWRWATTAPKNEPAPNRYASAPREAGSADQRVF